MNRITPLEADVLNTPLEDATFNLAWSSHTMHILNDPVAGRAEASARELLRAPLDPKKNEVKDGTYSEGVTALVRMLVRFERWADIIADKELIEKPEADEFSKLLTRCKDDGCVLLWKVVHPSSKTTNRSFPRKPVLGDVHRLPAAKVQEICGNDAGSMGTNILLTECLNNA